MIIISIIQFNMNFIILTKVSLKSQFVNYEIDNKAKIIELCAVLLHDCVLSNKKKIPKKKIKQNLKSIEVIWIRNLNTVDARAAVDVVVRPAVTLHTGSGVNETLSLRHHDPMQVTVVGHSYR